MNEYPTLNPNRVFAYFAAISQIPRESGNEVGIADYLERFAQEHQLRYRRDEANNIYIYKSGTAGREKLPPLILQGHVDMVCVRGPESSHRFDQDPIRWRVEGDLLYADHTTLGADNGIAVAYSLALLESTDIPHPPLEVLLTTEEETGMGGANGVHGEWLQGRSLLNLDAEEEGVFFTSCAGGANLRLTFFPKQEPVYPAHRAYVLRVVGLLSGHSGMEIVKQRANAIQLLARVLQPLVDQMSARLVNLHGGTKHNAIAAQAEATLVLPADAPMDRVEALLQKTQEQVRREFQDVDPDIQFTWEETVCPDSAYAPESTRRMVGCLYLLPHGVISMEPALPGLVRTSLNLGVLQDLEGMVELVLSVRSSLASEKQTLLDRLIHLAEQNGWQAQVETDYPAWEYRADSPLRSLAERVYREQKNEDPVCSAIHAGLECGLLSEKLPGCDMLSLGPDLFDVHTASEHLSISSVERTYTFLKQILAEYGQ